MNDLGARHPLSIAHLVMGVALLGLLLVWALVALDLVAGTGLRFLFPVPWILAGVAGLLALVVSDRRALRAQRARRAQSTDPWSEPASSIRGS
ncbi:hypothetical protein [Nocardioides sp.]|uniref:hypothetical protein n=1 Tax=Nocardioides sp. TaxID=35761 RepID=UPI002B273AED|nr:hypothetical protein [Nocardioides sp.]